MTWSVHWSGWPDTGRGCDDGTVYEALPEELGRRKERARMQQA